MKLNFILTNSRNKNIKFFIIPNYNDEFIIGKESPNF